MKMFKKKSVRNARKTPTALEIALSAGSTAPWRLPALSCQTVANRSSSCSRAFSVS